MFVVMGVSDVSVALLFKDDSTMPMPSSDFLKKEMEVIKLSEILESRPSFIFTPTTFEGGLVLEGTSVMLARSIIDNIPEDNWEGLITTLDIIDRALEKLGLKVKIEDTPDVHSLGERGLPLPAKMFTNPDTGKMSWDLYIEVQAGILAGEISKRIAQGVIEVKDGTIRGVDLYGALLEIERLIEYLRGKDSFQEGHPMKIPTVELLITTTEPVTDEQLSALKEAGYTVLGAFGRFIQVKAEITTLFNLKTGLQNFYFVQSADLPPPAFHK